MFVATEMLKVFSSFCKCFCKRRGMTETLAHGYSSVSAQRDLSYEYQHDRVKMVFENICVLMLLTNEDSVFEGLSVG